MNLAEARQRLDQLRSQARRINETLSDPRTRLEIGLADWPLWKKAQILELGKVERAIAEARFHIRNLERQRAEDRQTRMLARSELVERASDPAMYLLCNCLDLLIHLQADGLELSPDELSLVDTLGHYLKSRLGVTARGNDG